MEKYAGVRFRTRIEKGSVGDVSGFLEVDRALAKYLKPEGNEGNMSMRTAEGFLIKKAGARMTSLGKKDVVLVKKAEGNVVYAVGGTPSSESILHHEIYKKRKDAGIVLHFHNDALLEMLDWETVGPFPYGSRKLADAVGKAAGKTDRIKIAGHGFVIIAKEKKGLMEILEELSYALLVPQTGHTAKKESFSYPQT